MDTDTAVFDVMEISALLHEAQRKLDLALSAMENLEPSLVSNEEAGKLKWLMEKTVESRTSIRHLFVNLVFMVK